MRKDDERTTKGRAGLCHTWGRVAHGMVNFRLFCLTCVVVQILNYSFRNLSSLGRTLPLEKRGKVGQGVKSARQVCSSDDKSRQGPTRFADVGLRFGRVFL